MIILNELNYAEERLINNDIGEKPYTTISILAKYYYHHCGYKRKKIIELLTEFLDNAYPVYANNKSFWKETIDRIAENAKKYQLYEIEGIWITAKELGKIQELRDKVLERLAFTLLCLAKLSDKKTGSAGWVNNDAKEIFSLARISGEKISRDVRIANLVDGGYLQLPSKNDSLSVKVTFMDTESEKGEIFVSDFRELGYEYMKYCGQNITRCKECGILYRNSKQHPTLYCKACRGYSPMVSKKIICIDCGVEFEVDGIDKRTCRCESCRKKNREKYERERYEPIVTKTIICADCGKEFVVNGNGKQTYRCESCYSEYRKNYLKEAKRKQRDKEK